MSYFERYLKDRSGSSAIDSHKTVTVDDSVCNDEPVQQADDAVYENIEYSENDSVGGVQDEEETFEEEYEVITKIVYEDGQRKQHTTRIYKGGRRYSDMEVLEDNVYDEPMDPTLGYGTGRDSEYNVYQNYEAPVYDDVDADITNITSKYTPRSYSRSSTAEAYDPGRENASRSTFEESTSVRTSRSPPRVRFSDETESFTQYEEMPQWMADEERYEGYREEGNLHYLDINGSGNHEIELQDGVQTYNEQDSDVQGTLYANIDNNERQSEYNTRRSADYRKAFLRKYGSVTQDSDSSGAPSGDGGAPRLEDTLADYQPPRRVEKKEERDNVGPTVNIIPTDSKDKPPASKPNVGGAGANNMCKRCNKRVYEMEKMIADRDIYHKICFKCMHCKRTLSLGNYAAIDGQPYCKPHFIELFKKKGRYDMNSAQPRKEAAPPIRF